MTSVDAVPAATGTKLRRYNLVMGVLHAVQGVAVVVLATDFTLPVVATFLSGIPGVDDPELTPVMDVNLAWGVAAFLLLSALAHFLIASPGLYERYITGLNHGRNYGRWIEYSVSSSLMIVLIALLVGVADLAALVALAGVNASMILFGLLQEKYESPGKKASLLPFWLGCLAGIVPWIAITLYLLTPGVEASPPGFVYGIFFSLFLFFNSFAVVQYLQYRQIGKWRSYVYGESTYILLSLIAKSLLAWQIFGGTLAG
jgi:hypothetical protein